MNQFLTSARKYDTVTENGAIAHSSTGSVLADQFSKAGSHRDRDIRTVFVDQSSLDATYGSSVGVRFILYLRLITRKPKGWFDSDTLMKGQGNKDESFKRYLWYLNNKPEVFYDNLWLFIVCGAYKDLWELISLANKNGITIEEKRIFEVYEASLRGEDDLAKKYLPQIVANSKTKTDRSRSRNRLAKDFAKFLGLSSKEYRLFKTTGKAHNWQQAISQGLYDNIEFGKISGKALSSLVNGKFLKRQNLERKYQIWLTKQPIVKFTGYVYDLFKLVSYNMPLYKKMTVDKQFDGLIKIVEDDKASGAIKGNVWCALDTSSSMTSSIGRGKLTAYDICVSLGIYFSTLNKGAFHKNVIMFDSTSTIRQLKGTFSDMANDIKSSSTAWGSTNFQSVIEEILRVRKQNPSVPLEDYPQTLVVVSDMQFNPSSTNKTLTASQYEAEKNTNYNVMMSKLKTAFPETWVNNFKVIWWDCSGRVAGNQPSSIEDGGTYVFSGFDGAILSILLGEKAKKNAEESPSMEDVINEALSQEVLLQVKA